MKSEPCPICKNPNTQSSGFHEEGKRPSKTFHCDICGTYDIDHLAETMARQTSEYPGFSAWIREHQLPSGFGPSISFDDLENLPKTFPSYLITHKQNLLLKLIEERTEFAGANAIIDEKVDYPIIWARNVAEFHYIYNALSKRNLIEGASGSPRITPDGWDRLDQIKHAPVTSDQVFVAMSFNSELLDIYTGAIKPAIEDAGYKAFRVDSDPHIEKIDDRIIAAIRESKFLVADVTEHKQGVYYEAGFAQGLGLGVIWTVREDDLQNAHFDTRQYSHIVWDSKESFKQQLYNSICANFGKLN